jgi:tetrathionate reductase subunit A
LSPENGILINPVDAIKLNLKAGQRVKVVSATNPKGIWPVFDGFYTEMNRTGMRFL